MSINFNRLLANSNNENENENNEFVRNLENGANLFIENKFNSNKNLLNKTIKVTKPSLIMYNVTVNNDTQIDLSALANKIKLPFEKHVFDNNGIEIQVTKVTGLTGRFQRAFTITNAYSQKGSDSRVFALDFYIKVKLGRESVNATFTLFKNGKIKLSGGYLSQNKENVDNDFYFEAQPEMIREYIVDTYTGGQEFLRKKFIFNNVVGEFRVNKSFNPDTILEFTKNNYNVVYQPETSRLFKLKTGGYNFTISPKGVIQIRGLREQDSLDKAYKVGIKFLNKLTEFERSTGGRRKLYKNMVPQNRVSKKHNFNPNAPAPEVTRRGTSCPKSRCPDPYSFQGKCPKDGYYVRPNPQGQPCCYRIPKNVKYSRKRVIEAYEHSNVKVPNNVQRQFRFGGNTNNKLNNTTHANLENLKIKINSKVGLKIGSRQCSRYSKVALVDIAHRLGLPVSPLITKPKLCELIATRAENVTNTNNVKGSRAVVFSNMGKNFAVTGNSPTTLKIGNRFAKTFKKEVLFRFATKLGVRGIPQGVTTAQLCVLIFQRMNELRPVTPSPSTANSFERELSVTSPSPEDPVNKLKAKFRLTSPLLREDIQKFYGNNNVPNLNNKVTQLLNMINKAMMNNSLPKSKSGMPLKSGIQQLKKRAVTAWKKGKAPKAAKAPGKKVQNLMDKLRLRSPQLREDIVKIWGGFPANLESKVTALKNHVSAEMGKMGGIPTAENINRIKRQYVTRMRLNAKSPSPKRQVQGVVREEL